MSRWEDYSVIPVLLKEANKLTEFNDQRSILLGQAVNLYRQLRKEDDGGILWESYKKEYPNTLNDLHLWDQIYAK